MCSSKWQVFGGMWHVVVCGITHWWQSEFEFPVFPVVVARSRPMQVKFMQMLCNSVLASLSPLAQLLCTVQQEPQEQQEQQQRPDVTCCGIRLNSSVPVTRAATEQRRTDT